jgi:hypothetical protein
MCAYLIQKKLWGQRRQTHSAWKLFGKMKKLRMFPFRPHDISQQGTMKFQTTNEDKEGQFRGSSHPKKRIGFCACCD